jgi:hypothetical protein
MKIVSVKCLQSLFATPHFRNGHAQHAAWLGLWHRAGSRDWSVEQLARIYVAPPTAKGILEDLMRRVMVVAG